MLHGCACRSRQQTSPAVACGVSCTIAGVGHNLDIVGCDTQQYVFRRVEDLCQLYDGYPSRFVHACVCTHGHDNKMRIIF